ncbi:MAG: glycosyltransferase family 2 protein, partial [Bacilli bacterium]|nr:glycosyltransferase family 2 protein [Bacilli bacterium]
FMKEYLISFVVTVYNKELTLRRCLDSILKINGNNYGIVIIDDGSTDGSNNIIDSYNKLYSNIKVYKQKHEGISAIRKNASSYVSSKYMIFVDADDTINEELFFKLSNCINNYEPDIIKFDINEINSNKDKNRYVLKIDKIFNSGRDALLELHNKNIRYGIFGMYCFKSDFYEKIMKEIFYSLDCYEDVANIPKILFLAKKVVIIDYLGYNYYRNKNSITGGYNKKYKLLQFQKAYNSILKFFEDKLDEKDELYLMIKDYYDFHLKRKKEEFEINE